MLTTKQLSTSLKEFEGRVRNMMERAKSLEMETKEEVKTQQETDLIEREVRDLEEGVRRAEERLKRMKQEKWKDTMEEMLKQRVKEIMKLRMEQELEELIKEANKIKTRGNYSGAGKIYKEVSQERMELSAEDSIGLLISKS